MENDEIRKYYDGYVKRQARAGVNERHHTIMELALQHGLKKDGHVLEIGCGIGTFTGLLAKYVTQGTILAVDISPESIDLAIKTLGGERHVSFQVANVAEKQLDQRFDMIILPDVLEHIPLQQHGTLFTHLAAMLADDGRILIHSPDPFYSEWVRRERPELLQVLDLALYLPETLAHIERSNLILHHFQRHAVWLDTPEYMALVLVHRPDVAAMDPRIRTSARRSGGWRERFRNFRS